MILADLGAEVIKVEPPGGDKTRNLPGLGIGFFRSFNRNKKSVVLDINTPKARPPRSSSIEQSDVVLENFRPGLMTKLGLDYDTLSKGNSAPHLRLAQGLPARAVREPARARRSGADDGRALVHDGPQGPPAARGHLGERHHGRHVRRDRRARRAARARPHRQGPGDPERAVRELRVPVRPAHAAIRDDRRGAAADAVARLGLERLRRVRRWPTASSSSSAPSATSSSGPCATCSSGRTSPNDPALRPMRSASRCGPSFCAARSDPQRRTGKTSSRPSSKRPASPTRRSCVPSSCWTTRTCGRAAASCRCRPTTADDRRRAPALALGGRRPGVRSPLARVGEHTEEVLASLGAKHNTRSVGRASARRGASHRAKAGPTGVRKWPIFRQSHGARGLRVRRVRLAHAGRARRCVRVAGLHPRRAAPLEGRGAVSAGRHQLHRQQRARERRVLSSPRSTDRRRAAWRFACATRTRRTSARSRSARSRWTCRPGHGAQAARDQGHRRHAALPHRPLRGRHVDLRHRLQVDRRRGPPSEGPRPEAHRPPHAQRVPRAHGVLGGLLREDLQLPRDPLLRHQGRVHRPHVEGDDRAGRQDPHSAERGSQRSRPGRSRSS